MSLPIEIVKNIARVSFKFYFNRIEIEGRENLPKSGPVMYCPNHQSAFLDAALVICMLKKMPYSLARADMFQVPILRPLLSFMHISPIYRMTDHVGDLKEKNKQVFKFAYNLLDQNKALIIFPEGTHEGAKYLKPVKKGAARIAFGAYEAMREKKDIKIVPIGIDYSNYENSGSNVVIKIGQPISVEKHLPAYEENEAKAVNALTQEIKTELSHQMLDFKTLEDYRAYHKAFTEKFPLNMYSASQLLKNFHLQHKLTSTDDLNAIYDYPNAKFNQAAELIYKLFFGVLGMLGFLTTGVFTFVFAETIDRLAKDRQMVSSLKWGVGVVFATAWLFVVPHLLENIFQLENTYWLLFIVNLVSYYCWEKFLQSNRLKWAK